MEVLIGAAIVLGLWWALSAKRTSQAAIRYQAHKDALDEARSLLRRFKHRRVEYSEDVSDYFDLKRVPIELRKYLASDLEDLAVHVDSTRIPHDLGKKDDLQVLLETLTRARAFADGRLRPGAIDEIREKFVDETFGELRRALKDYRPGSLSSGFELGHIRDVVEAAEESLGWKVPGKRVSLGEAKKLLKRAHDVPSDDGPGAATRS